MIFKVLPKNGLEALFDVLSNNRIIGPVEKARGKNGKILYGFDRICRFENLRLDYTTTTHSPKKFFLPYKEVLSTFILSGRTWQKSVDYNAHQPHVFFGMHACDINALNKLDKVMIESVYPNPYYAAKRRNTFIVGIDCTPQPQCFCRSMNADTVLHGFDMFLTDIGEDYFVEIQTAVAYEILKSVITKEPSAHDHALFMKTVDAKKEKYSCQVDTTDLTKILDMEFQAEVWRDWGNKCLSCGTCANVCPTCYCFGVQESVDLDLQGAVKKMHLYSCNLFDFAEVAGGHNFRPKSHTRLKYRFYHKHRGFVEAFEEPLCVGCGRCGAACLADITVPEVIASVRKEAQGNG
ncbi:MAG: 4Fe-4S dicluster domain-containing protein [Desulfobulbaceae bacterium]|nr:4Fe-4S dicluster domain-containing protein [Desulfobulbaceae bacterium]